jgi:hypothetical protein
MVFGMIALTIVVLFLTIIITVHGRTLRNSEVSQSLGEAMQTTMNHLLSQNAYTIADKDDFVADFLETFLLQVNSDSDITVNILKADYEKGLLSVEVIETYIHPNGEKGQVSACRTILLDKKK